MKIFGKGEGGKSVNCIILWERKGIEFTSLPVSNKKVQVSANWRPSFNLGDFIPCERTKRWFQFWKSAGISSYLILREGLDQAVSPKGFNFDPHWSLKESQKFVAKMIAQSLETAKPMTFWQILPLYIMGGITTAGVIYIAIRAF